MKKVTGFATDSDGLILRWTERVDRSDYPKTWGVAPGGGFEVNGTTGDVRMDWPQAEDLVALIAKELPLQKERAAQRRADERGARIAALRAQIEELEKGSS